QQSKPGVIIARDTRASGTWIEEILARGIEQEGGNVVRAGVISTPGVAYLTRHFNFDSGIMISASHNPYQDNGIKIFSREGTKLSDEEELALERHILDPDGPTPKAAPVSEAECSACDLRFFHRAYFEAYINFLLQTVKMPVNLRDLRVVIDCANGAV